VKIKPRIELDNRTKLETVIPLSTPFVIYVDPSDKCNFQCSFCPTADRELMKKTPGRNYGLMDFDLYKKIIDDICQFEHPIKVLRLYKDGEPLAHPRFADMVKYAKDMGCADKIDTTTNGSLLSPQKNLEIIEAGLDRINISIYGINKEQYLKFNKFNINFERLVDNVHHLYEHRKNCEMIVKINGDIISQEDEAKFYEIFGEIADGVFVEHIMSCWSGFDFDSKGVEINQTLGIYGQELKEVEVCPYVFYSFSINSDGTVSTCFLDWSRKLVVGNTRIESVKDIWNGAGMMAHRKMMLSKNRKAHPICGSCGQMSHGLPDDIDSQAEVLLEKF